MNSWRWPQFLKTQGGVMPAPGLAVPLQQRLGDLPKTQSDRAFLDAIEESNCLPIPNDLALSIHIPSEEETGLSYQKWASPMIEHIKRLANHLDADRQVKLVNIFIEYPQPMALMIGHLVHRIESHFPIAEDALLNIVAPAGLPYDDLFVEPTSFKRIHIDYRLDDSKSLPKLPTETSRDFVVTVGITPCKDFDLSDLNDWLDHWSGQKPTRISLEALMSGSGHISHPLSQAGHDDLWAKLRAQGYHLIGAATFAQSACPLAQAFIRGELGLDVEGYVPAPCLDHFGIGLGAISQTGRYLTVNQKKLERYLQMLRNQHLPIESGGPLNQDTLIREAIVTELTCRFRLPIDTLQRRFLFCFKHQFGKEYEAIAQWVKEGLMKWQGGELLITDQGLTCLPSFLSMFARPINSTFQPADPISTLA